MHELPAHFQFWQQPDLSLESLSIDNGNDMTLPEMKNLFLSSGEK